MWLIPKWIKKINFRRKIRKPETEKHWTTLYFGERGSCKSIHQAKETRRILHYLDALYVKYPYLSRSIVFTNQKFNEEIEKFYLGRSLYYWEDIADFRYCPRANCWRGEDRHPLHACYLIFDDIATILPNDNWQNTPLWLRKLFSQARHNSVRVLANLQDPFSVDINFRRYCDNAFKFSKLFGNRDPDETKPPIKVVFGIYRRREVRAATLWQFGNMTEQAIRLMLHDRDQLSEQLKKQGREFDIVVDNSWRGSYHWFNRKDCAIYDTTQNVKEYEPIGLMCRELKCIDPAHDHINPAAPNYCKYKKRTYEIV